jgi:hypothetical protein
MTTKNKKLTAAQIRDLVIEKLKADGASWDGHGWFTLGNGKRVSRNWVENFQIGRKLPGGLSPAERKRRASYIFRSVPRELPALLASWPADLKFEDDPEAVADISCGLPKDLTGMIFGRLTVIGKDKGSRRQFWACACSCGQLCVASRRDIQSRKRSCGCLRRDAGREVGLRQVHGHTVGGRESPTHVTWRSMLERCSYPSACNFHRYGGAGITVCEEWHDFSRFLADVGERPAGKTLDRIDGRLGYAPGNVRWATPMEQVRNRRPPRSRTAEVAVAIAVAA